MERFLLYSLERQRPIRLIFQRDGRIWQRKVQVLALNENTVRLSSVRPREEWEMPREDLLGAEYAPGTRGRSKEDTACWIRCAAR